MWDASIITDAGMELLRGWVAGRTLTVDGAKAGSGVVPAEALAGCEALCHEEQALSLAGWEAVEGGARVEIVIQGPEKGYVANQIGLWAHLDGGESVLFALYQDERGIDVPARTEMPEFRYAFFAVIALHGSGELAVTVDPSLSVSREEFEAHVAACHGWHHGAGSPTQAAPAGDFYLDTASGDVYRREADAWVREGNIRGAGGIPGVALGARWHHGVGIAGTSGEETAYPGSGVERAEAGDCYLNTDTGHVYRCARGGGPEEALWVYVLCLRGPEGEAGPQGNVNVSFGTAALEEGVSSLENGLMYFVYEGAEKLASLPMESLIGVPLAAGAVAMGSGAVVASDAATVWYEGEGVTGTDTEGAVFPGSGVLSARVGDFYKHAGTGRLYRCVQGGGPEAALWAFLMDLHGRTGPRGATGGLYVQIGTEELTPGESELEAGKFHFVYEGPGEGRSWYASTPMAEAAGDYRHAGSVASYAALPEEAAIGDVYDVADTGMNYRWDGSRWDELGARIDVASAEEADAMLKDAFGQ